MKTEFALPYTCVELWWMERNKYFYFSILFYFTTQFLKRQRQLILRVKTQIPTITGKSSDWYSRDKIPTIAERPNKLNCHHIVIHNFMKVNTFFHRKSLRFFTFILLKTIGTTSKTINAFFVVTVMTVLTFTCLLWQYSVFPDCRDSTHRLLWQVQNFSWLLWKYILVTHYFWL